MEITICIGSSCHLKGSRDVISILQRLVSLHHLEDKIELKGSFCMGECMNNGVCVCIDGERFNVLPYETEKLHSHSLEGIQKELNLFNLKYIGLGELLDEYYWFEKSKLQKLL